MDMASGSSYDSGLGEVVGDGIKPFDSHLITAYIYWRSLFTNNHCAITLLELMLPSALDLTDIGAVNCLRLKLTQFISK